MDDLTKNSVSVTQTQILTPDGSVKRLVEVTYKLGDHGPFTVSFPFEQFSAAAVNTAIAAMQRELSQVIA